MTSIWTCSCISFPVKAIANKLWTSTQNKYPWSLGQLIFIHAATAIFDENSWPTIVTLLVPTFRDRSSSSMTLSLTSRPPGIGAGVGVPPPAIEFTPSPRLPNACCSGFVPRPIVPALIPLAPAEIASLASLDSFFSKASIFSSSPFIKPFGVDQEFVHVVNGLRYVLTPEIIPTFNSDNASFGSNLLNKIFTPSHSSALSEVFSSSLITSDDFSRSSTLTSARLAFSDNASVDAPKKFRWSMIVLGSVNSSRAPMTLPMADRWRWMFGRSPSSYIISLLVTSTRNWFTSFTMEFACVTQSSSSGSALIRRGLGYFADTRSRMASVFNFFEGPSGMRLICSPNRLTTRTTSSISSVSTAPLAAAALCPSSRNNTSHSVHVRVMVMYGSMLTKVSTGRHQFFRSVVSDNAINT